ncbi:hypothetical protein H6B10_17100, partial [Gemmiger formicilis]|uniref:hypothetical protein n=1 Tax=Gemmiger formicilis TaxID=745368 RepID=UPI001959C491
GRPIDGLGPIECTETRPIEHEAPGVVSREPVTQPMQTADVGNAVADLDDAAGLGGHGVPGASGKGVLHLGGQL